MKFAKVSNSVINSFTFYNQCYRLSVQPSVEGIEDINSLVFNEEYKRFSFFKRSRHNRIIYLFIGE